MSWCGGRTVVRNALHYSLVNSCFLSKLLPRWLLKKRFTAERAEANTLFFSANSGTSGVNLWVFLGK